MYVSWVGRIGARVQLVGYLSLSRARAIPGFVLTTALLLAVFSGIDMRISRLFFDSGFHLGDQDWARFSHKSVSFFVVGSMVLVCGIYVFNRFSKRLLFGVDGKKVVYLFLVLIVGAGLIVNVIFKDNFGRARPRDIVEFGGSGQFTPAFVVSSACDRNCSFSSGDSAGAFFSLAFIQAFRRKRATDTIGVGYGVLVSVSRIASGAHFLSDAVVSFFVMLLVSDALHYYMFQWSREPVTAAPAPSPGLLIYAAEKPSAPT